MPPVSGNAPATSASVSAPHNATTPPAIQTPNTASGPGSRFVTPAGVRKIPLPIVMPTTTAIALHKPSRRGSTAGEVDPGVTSGVGLERVGMVVWAIPYGTTGGALPKRALTFSATSGPRHVMRLSGLDPQIHARL